MAWPSFSFIFVLPGRGELFELEEKLFVSLVEERLWAEAVKFYEVVLQRDPDYPPVLNALAKVAYENRDYEAAFRLLSQLVKRFPKNPLWLNNFAVVSGALGELAVARGVLLQALSISGEKAELLYNLGCLAICENDLLTALQSFRRVLTVDCEHRLALFALSRVAKESGFVSEAIACCRKLVELVPTEAEFRYNLGLVLLKNGDWKEGFSLYEARWQSNRLTMFAVESLWQGQALAGKTILVWAEQGFGDTINFARYLPLLQKLATAVIVAVQDSLVALFVCSFPGVKVISLGQRDKLEYDFQVPFLSLTRLLQAVSGRVPATIPYLAVGEKYRCKWQVYLTDDSMLRVGLVWAGNPKHANDANRSISSELFTPLLEVSGVRFYSLQKESAAEDLKFISVLPQGMRDRFVDLASGLDDFQDTAAILQNLDLLISVDTSVAHLAGALGCPTWLLLPFDADWRWLMQREDSPWYLTMRLFRQPQPGDWELVMDNVSNRLKEAVNNGSVKF